MALDSIFMMGWQNDLLSLSLASNIAADAAHPIDNLLSTVQGRPTRWDMTGATNLQITGSSAEQFIANMFLMPRHNFLSDTLVRLRLYEGENETDDLRYDSASDVHALFAGAVGDYFSTPDSAAASITNALEIEADAEMASWFPATNMAIVGKWEFSTNQRAYILRLESTGKLRLFVSTNGTDTPNAISSEAVGFAANDRGVVKVTFNPATSQCRFWKSSDSGESFTEVGTAQTLVAASIFDSTAPVHIGQNETANDPFAGKIYRAQIRNGIDGPVVVDFDPRRHNVGASTFGSPTGETWTLNGNVSVEYTATVIYTIAPWTEMLPGIDPWKNYYDSNSNLAPVFGIPFDAVRYKSMRLNLDIPSPVNNIASIDKLALCWGYQPLLNYDYGSRTSIVDDSRHHVMASGGIRTVNFPARRRFEIDFSFAKDRERAALMHIAEKATMGGDIYIIGNPNAVGWEKFLSTGIFKRMNNALSRQIFHEINELSFDFMEN